MPTARVEAFSDGVLAVVITLLTLIPFPTRLVGEYPGFSAPLALQGTGMFLTSLSFAAMRIYASYHRRLLRPHIDDRRARSAMRYSVLAPVLYAISVACSFVWPPAAIGAQILVLALFLFRAPIGAPSTIDAGITSVRKETP